MFSELLQVEVFVSRKDGQDELTFTLWTGSPGATSHGKCIGVIDRSVESDLLREDDSIGDLRFGHAFLPFDLLNPPAFILGNHPTDFVLASEAALAGVNLS